MSAERALTAYAARIAHVHLKDVRRDVLEQVCARGLDFWTAIERGVFCPLGEGVVSLPGVLDSLAGAGYRRYATIEQDRVPGSGSPADDLQRSLDALKVARGRAPIATRGSA